MATKSEDVARAAGVSRATVSQILNGHGARFSAETLARVRRAVQDLDYRPSVAGRALASGASNIVVGLLPYTDLGGVLQEVLERETDALARQGITLVLRLATQTHASLEHLMASLRPRAVFSITPFTDEERALLARYGAAAVSPDAAPDFDLLAGRMQAKHLLERGCRRLAYAHIDDERYVFFAAGREQGVRDVCAERNLDVPAVLRPALSRSAAREAVDALEPGTGIACFKDDIAIALVNAARERGRRVPGDLAVMGMDGSPLAEAMGLSTLTVDTELAARGTVARVFAELGMPDPAQPPSSPLTPQVVARETT